jgi:hypothetical protein
MPDRRTGRSSAIIWLAHFAAGSSVRPQHTGNRDGAFAVRGQDPRRKNRNHHGALRRALSRVRELVRRLGGDVDPDSRQRSMPRTNRREANGRCVAPGAYLTPREVPRSAAAWSSW